MKYFLDTEFMEKPNTIELISIGIKCEDGRTLYEISKDFNFKKAWNDKWIRTNVLKSIFDELSYKENDKRKRIMPAMKLLTDFNYKNIKYLLKVYGKSISEIADIVLDFSSGGYFDNTNLPYIAKLKYPLYGKYKPEFYAYFSAYDWVVFCWIFGKMIDLPKGFPMYCKDLKQIMDEKGLDSKWKEENCPDPVNEHSALADAKWNFELYNKLNNN